MYFIEMRKTSILKSTMLKFNNSSARDPPAHRPREITVTILLEWQLLSFIVHSLLYVL